MPIFLPKIPVTAMSSSPHHASFNAAALPDLKPVISCQFSVFSSLSPINRQSA
jgi:hypothetical protein